MDIHFRQNPSCRRKHPGVRNDQGIRPHFPKLLKIPLHLVQVLIVGQDIGCHIHLDAPAVGKPDALFHILHGKIVGLCPKPESLSADIHGIRAVDHRGFQHTKASRRHQQLRLSHPVFLSVSFLCSFKTLKATPSPTGTIAVSNSSMCFKRYKYSLIRPWMVRSLRSTP